MANSHTIAFQRFTEWKWKKVNKLLEKQRMQKQALDLYEPFFTSLCEGLFAYDMFEEVSNSARYARLEQLDNDEWQDLVIPYHSQIYNNQTVKECLAINQGIQSTDIYEVFRSLVKADKLLLCFEITEKHKWPLDLLGVDTKTVTNMWLTAAGLIESNPDLHTKLQNYYLVNNLQGSTSQRLFEIAIQSTSEDPWDGL